jgi:ubiquinone/menaquinone biosynthesis C-methylase UbiE
MSLPAYAMSLAEFPQLYERWLVGPLFRPWAETLIERGALQRGERVLDVACGTGIVARLAKERVGGGRVVGIDVSPQMLAVARSVAPEIEWREGDASALPLAEGERFDAVFCQQGLQFIADREAALREMRRALDSGGRAIVAVWKSVEDSPFFRESYRLAERRLGPFVDRRHCFPDSAALEHAMTAAGFRQVGLESVARTIRFPDPDVFTRMNAMALVGMGTPPTTSIDERARLVDLIVDDCADLVRQYSDGEGLTFELPANVATAVAP